MAVMSPVGNVPGGEDVSKHVTIWNRLECRKIAGNAAPLRRNLERYLERHPECEVYNGQDKAPEFRSKGIDPKTGAAIVNQNEHVAIWHRWERRKVTGNAAPLRKNLSTYLSRHPECEEYVGQDKSPSMEASAVTDEWVVAAPPTGEPNPVLTVNDPSGCNNAALPPQVPRTTAAVPIPMHDFMDDGFTAETWSSMGLSPDLGPAHYVPSPLAMSFERADAHLNAGSLGCSPSAYLFLQSPPTH